MAKELSQQWFKIPSNGEHYFTPFKRRVRKYYALPTSGNKEPIPSQIAEEMNKIEHENGEYNRGGYFAVDILESKVKEGMELPNGVYYHAPETHVSPERLIPLQLRNDTYLKSEEVYNSMKDDIKSFFESEEIYRSIGDTGVQYRRGVLLYGPPGNGKTSLIREIIKFEAPENSVVIFFEKMPTKSFVQKMRKTLADRMKIIVFEELVAMLEDTRMERVLDFLDGETSLDRALVFATTNYPERLPANLVDRQSRFDKLYEIPDPDGPLRRKILAFFLRLKDEDISEEVVKLTKGLSVVALREVVIVSKVRKFTLEKAIASMRAHKEKVKKAFAKDKSMGFGRTSRDEDSYSYE